MRPRQPGDLAGFGIGRWIGQWEVERLSTNVTQVDASKIGRLLHDPVNSTQRRWIRSNFPNLPRCAPPTRANHVHLSRSSQNVKRAEAALTATAIPSFDARRLHRPTSVRKHVNSRRSTHRCRSSKLASVFDTNGTSLRKAPPMLAQHADSNSPFTTTGSASNSLPTLKLVTFVFDTDRSSPSPFATEVCPTSAG